MKWLVLWFVEFLWTSALKRVGKTKLVGWLVGSLVRWFVRWFVCWFVGSLVSWIG